MIKIYNEDSVDQQPINITRIVVISFYITHDDRLQTIHIFFRVTFYFLLDLVLRCELKC